VEELVMNSELISFYMGKIKHPSTDLTIDEMWEKSDNYLANLHNYIAWLFPTREKTYSIDSIALEDKEIEEFKSNPELRKRVMKSYTRLLKYFGFVVGAVDGMPAVIPEDDFEEKKKLWLTPRNSNYRKISRILQSLMLLGFKDAALLFFRALKSIYYENGNIIGESFEFWQKAIGKW
jgi:hypothetical protein